MSNYIGEIIFATRQKLKQTQDEYGSKYGISGPAVFKFEKGYVKPSLKLWLQMASQAGLSERRAVILLMKAKLPQEYQEYIGMEQSYETERKAGLKTKKQDYSKLKDRQAMLQLMDNDASLPSGLREMITDDEIWVLYKPTGKEINLLRDIFGPLGQGTRELFREALAVVREFKGEGS